MTARKVGQRPTTGPLNRSKGMHAYGVLQLGAYSAIDDHMGNGPCTAHEYCPRIPKSTRCLGHRVVLVVLVVHVVHVHDLPLLPCMLLA